MRQGLTSKHRLLLLLSSSLLAACGAFQRPQTSHVAQAFRSGDLCVIDVVTSFPSVHSAETFLFGGARSLSTSRFYLPALESTFTPAMVKMTGIDSKGQETPNPWRFGRITAQRNTVTFEIFDKEGETLIPWSLNGTYSLVGADVCRP